MISFALASYRLEEYGYLYANLICIALMLLAFLAIYVGVAACFGDREEREILRNIKAFTNYVRKLIGPP